MSPCPVRSPWAKKFYKFFASSAGYIVPVILVIVTLNFFVNQLQRGMEQLHQGRNNIVVLGAGFAGVSALLTIHRELRDRGLCPGFNLILVNRSEQHLYTPALYEIASIPRGQASALAIKSAICIPIPDIISRFPTVKFIGETVTKLDPEKRIVEFGSGDWIAFAYAVIALGAETNFFNIPGMAENAYPIKTFEDALRLRNRIEKIMATAKDAIRIIVGGAGATGVELSAELVNFLCHLKTDFNMPHCREEITLVEAGPEILAGFSPVVIHNVRSRLERLGIRIKTNAAIAMVSETGVTLRDGLFIPADILIWSGGIKPASAIANFGLTLDPKGAIVVNEFLEARPRIYAVGDCACFITKDMARPLPGNVPVAEAEAEVAARNIVAEIAGRERKRFQPNKNYHFILAVGGKYAISDIAAVKFFGLLGWMVKQLVELRYLLALLPWPKAVRMWLRAISYESAND